MIIKVHKKEGRAVVAVCDDDLLGRKFEEDNLQLDLSSDFYKGEKMDASEIGDIIRNADSVNLVGEESIKLALKEEVIDKENIIYVSGVPHAQATIVKED